MGVDEDISERFEVHGVSPIPIYFKKIPECSRWYNEACSQICISYMSVYRVICNPIERHMHAKFSACNIDCHLSTYSTSNSSVRTPNFAANRTKSAADKDSWLLLFTDKTKSIQCAPARSICLKPSWTPLNMHDVHCIWENVSANIRQTSSHVTQSPQQTKYLYRPTSHVWNKDERHITCALRQDDENSLLSPLRPWLLWSHDFVATFLLHALPSNLDSPWELCDQFLSRIKASGAALV